MVYAIWMNPFFPKRISSPPQDFARAEKAVEILKVDRQVQDAIYASDDHALGAALTVAERLGFGSILRRAQILEGIAENRAKVAQWLVRKEEKLKREARERRREKQELRSREAEEVRRKETAARAVYQQWKQTRDEDLRRSRMVERSQQQDEIRRFLEREAEVSQRYVTSGGALAWLIGGT